MTALTYPAVSVSTAIALARQHARREKSPALVDAVTCGRLEAVVEVLAIHHPELQAEIVALLVKGIGG